MNEEEKGIEIPCVHCGRQLKVSPGQSGLTSEDKIVLNLPGIACDDSCVDELLDMYDPLTCVYELSSELADSAMMEMQFVKGTEAAVDFFLQLFPTSADVIDAAAVRLYQEGDRKRAYDILEHGLKHCDDADKLRMELAAFTEMDGASLLGLEIMREVSPDAIRYHVVKGNLFRAADQWDEAADCWKMAIETDPSDEIAWFNLGYFLLSVEERFLDAEQHYQAACVAFPEERRFRAFLGDSLFYQGRKSEALKEYHRALPMQGGDSQFEDTLRSMIDQCE